MDRSRAKRNQWLLVNLLVSHDGGFYFVDHNSKTIRWSLEMKRSIYKGSHDDNAKEYIDAHEDGYGNIEIFHHKDSSRKILGFQDEDERMGDYLKYHFGKKVTHRKHEQIFHVNSSGLLTDHTSNVVRIKEVRHVMVACHWTLEVARFQAFLIGEDENQSQRIHVYHTPTLESFTSVGQSLNSDGFPMGDFISGPM